MNPRAAQLGKIASIVLWLGVAAAMAGVFPTRANQVLLALGLITLLAHVVEFGIFLRRYRAPEDRLAGALVQTLLFGIFFLGPRMRVSAGQ